MSAKPAAETSRKKTMAEKADIHDLYEKSVQDVERVAESLRPGQVVSLVVRSGSTQPRIVNYRVR